MDDSKSKALNWSQNIYNTFEGFVPVVDDIQDTFNYVENRVSTVKGSLKKFYSAVVLDFFPQSVDPAKAEDEPTEPEPNSSGSADQSTVPENDSGLQPEEAKPVTTTKEEEADDVDDEEEEEEGEEDDDEEEEEEERHIKRAFYSLVTNISEVSSTDGESSDEKSYASYLEPEDDSGLKPEDDGGLEPEEAKPVTATEEEGEHVERAFYSLVTNISEVLSTDGESSDEKSNVSENEIWTDICSARSLTMTRSLSDVSSLSPSSLEVSRIASDRAIGLNYEPTVETPDLPVESNDDSGVVTMEAISLQSDDKEEEVKLENNSVTIDDKVLHAVSRRSERLASYNNKLKAFFTSKARLVKEYEQLAIWFGDANIEPSPSSETSQPSRSYDLDWELL